MQRTSILVPLDGSEFAEAALTYAEAIARLRDAPLTLLGVVDERELQLPAGGSAVLRAEIERLVADGLQQYLATVVWSVSARGFEASTAVATGDPATEIVKASAGAAVTVMASRGRGGVQRLILGSVADKVLRSGTRPLLIVAPSAEAVAQSRGAPLQLRRFLVPLDGSPLAEAALPAAIDLATASGGTLSLVRVEPWIASGLIGYTAALNLPEIDASVEQAAVEYLEQVKAGLPAAVQATAQLRRGDPANGLMECVRNDDIDLVVMTTHGRGGIKRLLIGSTADRLVRLGAPVLLIPPAFARD